MGRPNTSATGRSLCDSCSDRLLGAAAGAIGASANGDSSVGGAIATSHWYSRLRRDRRGK